MIAMIDAYRSSAAELEVEVQHALEESDSEEPPSGQSITQWAQAAYAVAGEPQSATTGAAEVTIRIVTAQEMQDLNRNYRQQDKATNVLSFATELDAAVQAELTAKPLGDVIICHPVILREAQQQQKSTYDHYAHMVAHGVLHLCGFDHQNDSEAQQMETLETQTLANLQIANPYR